MTDVALRRAGKHELVVFFRVCSLLLRFDRVSESSHVLRMCVSQGRVRVDACGDRVATLWAAVLTCVIVFDVL